MQGTNGQLYRQMIRKSYETIYTMIGGKIMRTPFEDTQMQLGYIIYMMMGSYFDNLVCRTRNMEDKMQTYYRLMPEKDQVWIESECDQFMTENVLPNLPQEFPHGSVDVFLFRCSSGEQKGRTEVVFTDGFSSLKVLADRYRDGSCEFRLYLYIDNVAKQIDRAA